MLRSELDSDWLPDPWSWSDVHQLRATVDEEPIELLETPLVGGRKRVVPYLRPGTRLALNQTAAAIARFDGTLSHGVFGYRAGDEGLIRHYRTEYRRRSDVEASLAGSHPWVVRADLRRFFPSTTAAWLHQEIVGAAVAAGLPVPDLAILDRLSRDVGYPLPEGYAASRALANYGLRTVDSQLGVDFTRWIDDYTLFAPTETAARGRLIDLEDALVGTPYELAGEKTAVQRSQVAVVERPVGSLGDVHCDVGDVTAGLRALRDVNLDIRYERDARHYLRLAAERQDVGALAEVRWLVEHDRLPLACIPRLAWYLATVAAQPEAKAVVDAGLRLDTSDFAFLRLAPAMWSFDGTAVLSWREQLLEASSSGWMTWVAALRVVARHLPEDLAYMSPPDELPSTNRAWQLACSEARGHAMAPPPLATFL